MWIPTSKGPKTPFSLSLPVARLDFLLRATHGSALSFTRCLSTTYNTQSAYHTLSTTLPTQYQPQMDRVREVVSYVASLHMQSFSSPKDQQPAHPSPPRSTLRHLGWDAVNSELRTLCSHCCFSYAKILWDLGLAYCTVYATVLLDSSALVVFCVWPLSLFFVFFYSPMSHLAEDFFGEQNPCCLYGWQYEHDQMCKCQILSTVRFGIIGIWIQTGSTLPKTQ